MIGPHLTPENHVEVLGRAKFRTKKELGRLLRELNPIPQVPDRIEPLGPALPRALRNPTWEEYVTSLAPRVRELPVGERPHDWANEVELDDTSLEHERSAASSATPDARSTPDALDATVDDECAHHEPLPVGPVPQDLPPITGPQHCQVQFTTIEEHAQLVERAQSLLARSRPGMTLGELHLEAMKLLVASLEKRKFAITGRQRARAKATQPNLRGRATTGSQTLETPREHGDERQDSQKAARSPGEARETRPRGHDRIDSLGTLTFTFTFTFTFHGHGHGREFGDRPSLINQRMLTFSRPC